MVFNRMRMKENAQMPASDLYDTWSNSRVHVSGVLPDEYRIDLRGFHMPTPSRVVTSNFGRRWGRAHQGLDIKVYIGDTIRAAWSGKVRVVRYDARGYGKYVVIRHPNGLETYYGHLSERLVDPDRCVEAGQIIGYVSAHDNFTLWDKLLMVRYARPEFAAVDKTALAQNRLAAGIYLTSMGLPFWQAGEEFARTKKGQGNSYHSSPALNRLDWHRAEQFHSLVDYYRGRIGLRAAFPRLGALDKASPAAIEFFSLEQPLVGWRLPAQWGDGAAWSALCVYYNPTETAQVVTLPGGSWKLRSDGISSSLWRGSSRICTGQTVLLTLSANVIGQL